LIPDKSICEIGGERCMRKGEIGKSLAWCYTEASERVKGGRWLEPSQRKRRKGKVVEVGEGL
jgi:hypothetical protein